MPKLKNKLQNPIIANWKLLDKQFNKDIKTMDKLAKKLLEQLLILIKPRVNFCTVSYEGEMQRYEINHKKFYLTKANERLVLNILSAYLLNNAYKDETPLQLDDMANEARKLVNNFKIINVYPIFPSGTFSYINENGRLVCPSGYGLQVSFELSMPIKWMDESMYEFRHRHLNDYRAMHFLKLVSAHGLQDNYLGWLDETIMDNIISHLSFGSIPLYSQQNEPIAKEILHRSVHLIKAPDKNKRIVMNKQQKSAAIKDITKVVNYKLGLIYKEKDEIKCVNKMVATLQRHIVIKTKRGPNGKIIKNKYYAHVDTHNWYFSTLGRDRNQIEYFNKSLNDLQKNSKRPSVDLVIK